jgi:hypothetical protein
MSMISFYSVHIPFIIEAFTTKVGFVACCSLVLYNHDIIYGVGHSEVLRIIPLTPLFFSLLSPTVLFYVPKPSRFIHTPNTAGAAQSSKNLPLFTKLSLLPQHRARRAQHAIGKISYSSYIMAVFRKIVRYFVQ